MLCVCRRLGREASVGEVPTAPDFNQGAGVVCMPTNDCRRMAVLWSIAAAVCKFWREI